MKINHIRGRSIADTAALAALTGRSPWSVRTLCHRETPPPEPGYDVETATATLDAHPDEPLLLTATQAWEYLRVPAGSVRGWASLGRLKSFQRTAQGHPLYRADHILDIARRTP